MEFVRTHQHQSKMQSRGTRHKRRLRSHATIIGTVVGFVVFAVSLTLVVLTVITLRTSSQDWRQQATVPEGSVELQTSISPTNPSVGQSITLQIAMHTNSLQVDGLQLTLVFPASVSRPVASATNGGPLKVVHQRVVSAGQTQVLKVLLTSTTDGSAYVNSAMTPVLNVVFAPTSGGTISIEPDNLNSLVTVFNSVPPRDELMRLVPIQVTVVGGQTPSATPTVTASPTPGSNPTNTPTPTLSLTPTPTTPADPNYPRLVISYLHQGVPNQVGLSLDTLVWLVPVNQLDSNSNQLLELNKAYRVRSHTTTQGLVIEPIAIEPTLNSERVAVFVKTAHSLRRNLGTIILEPDSGTSNQITADLRSNNKQLLVGDFVQAPDAEFNQINILDLASMLEQFTELQKPITHFNRQYDVNFDNVISIFDIAMVLSNYTELSVRGD